MTVAVQADRNALVLRQQRLLIKNAGGGGRLDRLRPEQLEGLLLVVPGNRRGVFHRRLFARGLRELSHLGNGIAEFGECEGHGLIGLAEGNPDARLVIGDDPDEMEPRPAHFQVQAVAGQQETVTVFLQREELQFRRHYRDRRRLQQGLIHLEVDAVGVNGLLIDCQDQRAGGTQRILGAGRKFLVGLLSSVEEVIDLDEKSYLGLVPSEHSSGASVRRGGITKTGNSQARRVLIEAAWTYRHAARKTAVLQRRAERTPPPVQDIAWAA